MTNSSQLIYLNKPIRIAGQDVVLVLDTIVTDKTVTGLFVRAATEKHARIVVADNNSESIKNSRKSHPGVKTYGVWSLLIENDVIGDDELQYMELESGRGIYCLVENELIIESGFYTGDQIPARPDLTLDSGRIIPNSIAIFKKLPAPILTGAERASASRSQAEKTKKRRIYTFLGIVAIGIFAGKAVPLLTVNESLSNKDDQALLLKLTDKLSLLKKSRSTSVIKSNGLSALVWMSHADELLTTEGEVDMSSSGFTVVFSNSSLIPNGLTFEHLADGRASVAWSSREH